MKFPDCMVHAVRAVAIASAATSTFGSYTEMTINRSRHRLQLDRRWGGHRIGPGARLRAAAVLAIASLACGSAAAQSRWVFVNGQRLSDAKVMQLARANCSDIPDGAYWLNRRTGAWGFASNPQVQGVIGDRCGSAASAAGQRAGDGRYGPYATMRRAEEVANGFRNRGLRAVAFHNGDGYYVDVRR